MHRAGLRRLDWLVVRDFQLIETADFWRVAPEIERGEVRPEEIATEVFFFPAAAHTEKDGSFTNTQRLLQWHHKAIEPPGDCRSDLDFIFHLGRRLKKLYAGSTEWRDRPILDMTWNYRTTGPYESIDAESVLHEINGYTVPDGKPVDGFADLKDDGSTACGCWIYSGCYKDSVNQTARRKPHWEQNWVASKWGWSWPHNRRLLYNRASADPEGRPWSERKAYVWWDERSQKWTGCDEPDFVTKPPSYRPAPDARGKDTIAGVDPFVMQTDGKGWLFVPSGLLDAPLPTHYEPQESVIHNPLYRQQCNPCRMEWMRERDNPYHQPYDDPRYPYILTTYRVTEHHTAGGMSRWLSWLSELQPEAFCEVSPELAQDVGLTNGGWATIRSARAEVEARVLVTRRIRPLQMGGCTVHQIGMPYHWSGKGLVCGDAANDLISFVADPNVSIMESKALTVSIHPGRRSRVGSRPRGPDRPSREEDRDLPRARRRRKSSKDYETAQVKEGHT
jgi:formate dehydrogenase major subunit